MKVFDLQCGLGHAFEGWFSSEDDYQGQLARGLLECPLCADKAVFRLPSAPRLNLGASAGAPERSPHAAGEPRAAEPAAAGVPAERGERQALQAAWMHLVRRVVAETEDVGARFAEEARRIHHGQADARGIRGQATREETEALRDEGIPVLPLPLPAALKETLQ